MTAEDPSKMFNAYYYAHDCGRSYQRDDYWLKFFGGIADRILGDIQPQTVLDAGCALGILVEMLRRGGAEAFGVDISKFAIENVHESIKPFCWLGSVTESLPQKYDLIVSIEVLEHLSKEQSEQAVANLCAHTNDILFSSSPSDYKELTHFNVQPPEYWVNVFARHGFYRDVDFDASFITPWAVRFRRLNDPIQRVIAAYERKHWLLMQENQEQRVMNQEQRVMNQEQRVMNQEQRENLAALQREIGEKEAIVQGLEKELNSIKDSRTWRFLQKIGLPRRE